MSSTGAILMLVSPCSLNTSQFFQENVAFRTELRNAPARYQSRRMACHAGSEVACRSGSIPLIAKCFNVSALEICKAFEDGLGGPIPPGNPSF